MKQMKQIKINKWKDYTYYLKNNIINKDIINEALLQLFNEKLNNMYENQSIDIIFKIKAEPFIFRSISFLQTIKKKDFKQLASLFYSYWDDKSQEYHTPKWDCIVFTYKILSLESKIKNTNFVNSKEINLNKNFPLYNFDGFKLPATMDYSKWGEVLLETESAAVVNKIKKAESSSVYYIKRSEQKLEVEVRLENYNKKKLYSFTDTLNDSNNLATFTRIIGNMEYIFIDGILKLNLVKNKFKYLEKIKTVPYRTAKYITMDLETRTINKIMTPFCISIYDGKNLTSFYLTDFKNKDQMLIAAIKFLMKRKYDGFRIYLHNFANFDSIFLINILSLLSEKLNPIIKDGTMIDLKFYFSSEELKKANRKNKKYVLFFRDSYLILPASLRELAVNFKVENKGFFPFNFVNNNKISLLYEGNIPDYKYYSGISIKTFNSNFKKERESNVNPKYYKFKGITPDEYNSYFKDYINRNKKWNLREETIKYCEQDVLTLHQIITKFSKRIFSLFRLDFNKYPTLPSLSFAIFRAKFLKDSKIPLIYGEIYKNIKKAFTGGAVDVFKPYGENLKSYDVNSLYPKQMATFPMPVGNPTYFEGNIYLKNENPFGIFEVEVITPENVNIPILQVRVDTGNGIRTISPLGKWTSWYFSEELNNAKNYGYSFKILRGYIFEKKNIFKEFIDFLYKMKLEAEKGTPDYIISKLIMNSVYGRFAMDPEMENHKIWTAEEELEYRIKNKIKILNVIPLNKTEKAIVSFVNKNITDNLNRAKNVSIPISTAVTAQGRIHMSYFKMLFLKLGITLYYSDTDNVVIDQELDSKYIGKKLGQFKLENKYKKAIFLAPKVYGGLLSPDSEIVKVKGLKNPINFNELSSLLNKENKLEISQEKWYKNITDSKIAVKNEVYTLMVTDNKRKVIYNEENKFIDTVPYIINEKKEIINI